MTTKKKQQEPPVEKQVSKKDSTTRAESVALAALSNSDEPAVIKPPKSKTKPCPTIKAPATMSLSEPAVVPLTPTGKLDFQASMAVQPLPVYPEMGMNEFTPPDLTVLDQYLIR